MIKKYIVLLLLAVMVVSPTQFIFADTEASESLSQQVTALEKYISRVLLQYGLIEAEPISHDEIRTAIQLGTSWIINSQEESGHFAYEYLPYEDSYLGGDNIVRQAGTLYALTEVARRDSRTDEARNVAIERSIDFFEGLSEEHTFEEEAVRCIVRNEESKVCGLGATALALSGILGYVETVPEKADEYADLIEGYVTFILASKKEGTGFRDEYRLGIGFRGEKESSFSNGEALLALVRFYQYENRPEVKQVIDDAFMYFQDTDFDTPLYLWAMAALKDMQRLWPNEAYTEYGEAFTNWRLSSLAYSKKSNRNYCASTEGLASAYSLLEKSASVPMLLKLRKEIDFWNTKNIDLQIGSGDKLRLIPEEDNALVLGEVKNMQQSEGGFLAADDELTQRIDFTQHCVSSYLQTLVDIDGQSL